MVIFRGVPFSDDHLFTIIQLHRHDIRYFQALGADVAMTSVITARVVAYDLITVPFRRGGSLGVVKFVGSTNTFGEPRVQFTLVGWLFDIGDGNPTQFVWELFHKPI